MKNRIITIILTLIVFSITFIPVNAIDSIDSIYYIRDYAEVLTEDEAMDISSELEKIGDKLDYDLFIITVDSFEGSEPAEIAEMYRSSITFEHEDAVLMLVSMEEDNRECWIFPYGNGRNAFTDAGIDYILDEVTAYLGDDKFADGFDEFVNCCEDFIIQAESGEPYDEGNLPKEPFDIIINLAVSIVIGVIIAFIIVSVMKGKLKSVRHKAQANDYLKKGSLSLTDSRDYFLYRTITRTAKPKSNSSGGSSRSSSSGGSVGRGKSF